MRKIDKKLNLQKVNMLTEQRYLQSKGLLKDEVELQRGDEIVWIGPEEEITKGVLVKPGDKGEYIGRETSGEWVVEFGPRRFHTSETTFEKVNKGGLSENDLATYRSEMQRTGDYPWTRNAGNKEKADEYQTINAAAAENFKKDFKNKYNNQTIETSLGSFKLFDIKYRNNHGNYDLIFTKPKSENDFMDKTLWIAYDPTDGYYILDSKSEGIELTDDESKRKVIEMLSHNKE